MNMIEMLREAASEYRSIVKQYVGTHTDVESYKAKFRMSVDGVTQSLPTRNNSQGN